MIKQKISRNLLNLPGWRSKRKIVVIESDDWGTIRMASRQSLRYFLQKGYPVDQSPYNLYDALETNTDLEKLFDVLLSVKDKNGNPAVITANNVVANPDFEKIKETDCRQYFYEPFTHTLQRYPDTDKVMQLYRSGLENKIFIPQFHGREHVNIPRWLKALQQGDVACLQMLDHGMFSMHTRQGACGDYYELMDAYNIGSMPEVEQQKQIIADGLQLFEKIWGFASQSFIAPCYIWRPELEPVLAAHKVQFIQGLVNQMVPQPVAQHQFKKKFHYQGRRNQYGQRYLVRNAFFEPALDKNFDWLNDCLNRMQVAFAWHKPAIICSHRLNYTGRIDTSNRDNGLKQLQLLLNTILKNWPDVEFMSSDQLGQTILASAN